MSSADSREHIQAELLEALYEARKRVDLLESVVAHNAALMGAGVEREDHLGEAPPDLKSVHSLLHHLQLVEPEDDMSDYLGIEGDNASRPRLSDAEDSLRPQPVPMVSPQVGQLVVSHPDDWISYIPSIVDPDADEKAAPLAPVDTFLPAYPLDGPGGGQQEGAASFIKSDPPLETGSPQADTPLPSSPFADACSTSDNFIRSVLALQAVNDGVWDWNLCTGSVFQSERWKEILGCSGEPSGTPLDAVAECLHPADAESFRAAMADLLGGKTARISLAVRVHQAGNTRTWGFLRAVCLRQGGRPLRVVAAMADITEQREAKLALKVSEEKFRVLAEDSPDLVARFDAQHRLLYVSPSIGRYLSLPLEEILGKPFSALGIGGDSAFFEENLNRVFELGLPVQAEVHLQSPVVGEFVADCRFWPEFGMEGEVVSVMSQLRDMTFFRRISGAYKELFNSMTDGFALFEHIPGRSNAKEAYGPDDFTLISMNPAFCRMTGLDNAASKGKSLSDLLGLDAPFWAECLRTALTKKESCQCLQRDMQRDSVFEISAYSTEEGRVACIVKDVTELQATSRELRLNEARFAALQQLSHMDEVPEEDMVRFALDKAVELTGSSVGFMYLEHADDRGKAPRLYWSAGALLGRDGQSEGPLPELNPDLLHISKTEMVNHSGSDFADILGGPEEVARYILAPIIEDGRVVCVAGVANKAQEYENADLRQLEMFINGVWFLLRRRWSMQALIKAKEQAEDANTAKNQFLANVSHELRTPLNGILGMLQILQMTSLTEEQSDLVGTANNSGRALLRIISDILDFSRIEAGHFELAPQVFDFAATVRSTLDVFTHQIQAKGLTFTVRLDEHIPHLMVGDDARLRQIILNLVGNAYKFTEKGGITVECSLLPTHPKGKQVVLLSVQDTGIGIPDEKVDDIFQAFMQLDGSRKRRYAGTGLGLVIVKRLLDLMGGTLTVDSAEGKGTTFYCSLPFGEVRETIYTAPQSKISVGTGASLTCLVAEDDPVSQLTVRNILQKKGHTVLCVNNGRQALEALVLKRFDCLLSDIQMPEMDGLELVERIRKGVGKDIEVSEETLTLLGMDKKKHARHAVPRDLPVVALTAHAMTGDRERFLEAGMDYYLVKPIIAAELYTILKHISERRKAARRAH